MKLLIAALLMSVGTANAFENANITLDFPAPVSINVPDALVKGITVSNFSLGMTLDEVNAVIARNYSDFERSDVRRPLSLKAHKGAFGVIGNSQDFVNGINIWHMDDNNAQDVYTLYFTSPRTGARLFYAVRQIKYDKAKNKPLAADVENSVRSKWTGLQRDEIPYDGDNPAFKLLFNKDIATNRSETCEDIDVSSQYYKNDDMEIIQRNAARECKSTLAVGVLTDRAHSVLSITVEATAKELFWKSTNSDLSWFLEKYQPEIDRLLANQKNNAIKAPAL